MQAAAQTRDVVVIGASMGGRDALLNLVEQLPADLPASLFVVQHLAAGGPSGLASALHDRGALPASQILQDAPIERSRIYVAPPNCHLVVDDGIVRAVFGPRENRSRPAIDPLFRSAAVAFRSRVIGIILTGLLNDGAAGLHAVKRCGGVALVQDPADAAHPDMPRHAIEKVDVDHVVPLAEMGALLLRLIGETAPDPPDVPEDLSLETRLISGSETRIPAKSLPGTLSTLACPDCGGPLREMDDAAVRRYRCHVGHAFTAENLLADQDGAVEKALYIAMRTLKERADLLRRLARDERNDGRTRMASAFEDRADESQDHADRIQELLARLS